MQITGEQVIAAPRDVVWQALNDPLILKQCIPGCETIEKVSDTEFTAKVAIAVGPVRAKFTGRVLLSNLDPPNGYTISGEGQGGVAGFGKGGADVKLAEDGPSRTILSYRAEASVGGKLAQLGARLIDSTARKLADQFFAKFTATVGGPSGEPAPAESAAVAEEPAAQRAIEPALAPAAAASARPTAMSRQLVIWLGVLAVGAGIVLLLTGR
jgi:carbon monoxide dehydrogenase subunit G